MVFLLFKNVFMGVICILDTSTLFSTKVSKSDPTRVCRNYNQQVEVYLFSCSVACFSHSLWYLLVNWCDMLQKQLSHPCTVMGVDRYSSGGENSISCACASGCRLVTCVTQWDNVSKKYVFIGALPSLLLGGLLPSCE